MIGAPRAPLAPAELRRGLEEARRRRGGTEPLARQALAERAEVTRRTVLNEVHRGRLRATRERLDAHRSIWQVDPAEAERWLRTYTRHARTAARAA